MIGRLTLTLALALTGAGAAPAALETSPRPVARADAPTGAASEAHGPAVAASAVDAPMRPRARTRSVREDALAARLVRRMTRHEPVPRAEPLETFPGYDADLRAFAAASPRAVIRTLRPAPRSQALVQRAMARQREQERGQICGDPALQGEVVGYVPGRIAACGIDNAVRVRAVSGVALSQQALIDCRTAKALKTWVNQGMKPAVGRIGGGVSEIRVAAHFACRTRNNQPGAKVSEHGKGRAIDISAFRLRDGSLITVLGGWRTENQGPILRRMHRAACGPFGTVLGPESDRFHQDHFHFDTARHRGGSYCR